MAAPASQMYQYSPKPGEAPGAGQDRPMVRVAKKFMLAPSYQ